MLILHRTALRRRPVGLALPAALLLRVASRQKSSVAKAKAKDPRLADVKRIIRDDFAALRNNYTTPKHPIILAHGLLGFDELRLAGPVLPGIEYWYGITQALSAKGVEVITAAVPPSGSIEMRAARLAETIESKAHGKAVNIIAYVPLPATIGLLSVLADIFPGIAWFVS